MKQILNIAYYELRHVFKDPILFMVVFPVAILYMTLFGVVYIAGILNDIPTAVVNQDNSVLSREIVDAVRNDPHFLIIEDINTYPALEKGMKEGLVRAGIVIPEDFAQKVYQQRPTEVLAIYDASNLVWGYNIRKYFMGLINEFNVRHTVTNLTGLGLDKVEIGQVINAVDCNVTTLYNPTYNYNNFLFMGLMMMVIHQIGLLGVGLTVTREKAKNSWLQYLNSSIAAWKIVLGKCLPYWIINFANYALILWGSAHFVNVKIEGSVFLLILLGLLYCTVIIFTGFFISLKSCNSLQVTRYLLLLSVPMFLSSGYTWPPRYIPDILNAIVNLLPYTWMVKGFRMVSLKSLDMQYLSVIILVLAIMALLAVCLALTFDKTRKLPVSSELTVNGRDNYPQRGS